MMIFFKTNIMKKYYEINIEKNHQKEMKKVEKIKEIKIEDIETNMLKNKKIVKEKF